MLISDANGAVYGRPDVENGPGGRAFPGREQAEYGENTGASEK